MAKSLITNHAKRETTLRDWLMDEGHGIALSAMDFAKLHHKGLRKDGTTPEFSHFVEIAHFVRSLSTWLSDPETVLCCVFLHDVREDHGISDETIRSMFGDEIARIVEILSKKIDGVLKDRVVYFAAIASDPIAALVKGCDRIHNVQSMVGVFTLAKQKLYLQEVLDDFLPMLKIARRSFPELEPAYENVMQTLRIQVQLIQAIHAAAEAEAAAGSDRPLYLTISIQQASALETLKRVEPVHDERLKSEGAGVLLELRRLIPRKLVRLDDEIWSMTPKGTATLEDFQRKYRAGE